jgi:hypothetical protein
MKFREATICLALVLAAGCDTMEKDVDAKVMIDNEALYFLPNGGYIDLASKIVAPGKVTVEITTSTSNGELKDLGKGLLQYAPFKGSTNDFFRFRVYSDNNRVLADDSIGIVIPKDTTQLPCGKVYVRNDSVLNVTSVVIIDVVANDYVCGQDVYLNVSVAAAHGSATVYDDGRKIRYEPNETFTGNDQFMYKAMVRGHIETASYGMVWITKGNSPTPGCTPLAVDDLFYKPKNDTASKALNVLANDTLCDSTVNVTITQGPRSGFAYYDDRIKQIWYRNVAGVNTDDTLRYMACGKSGCSSARAIIKRN